MKITNEVDPIVEHLTEPPIICSDPFEDFLI